ncbi:hypothetical protein BDM02DRAFT_3193972 [Thelephora ganbajun]|uniref:Uncharacterized protein n=1 Tax=Thelephora ganbajun TaxID=370292 RepID=A0ACB6YYC2_THEGA|nr:hypothetical protein BDM02DRAFT_3193972 [Thelephora ganbajun]
MASFGFESGRQFKTDPISGQIFYREPIDGSYLPWTALEPSDYHHPPWPTTHNAIPPPSLKLLHTLPLMSLTIFQGKHSLKRRSDKFSELLTGPREGGRGRTRGAANYCPREVEVLLDLVEDELPVGAKGWNTVGTKFREWTITTGRPARTDRSLEAKYKQLVRTPKPTGDGECPPEIECAHELNDRIQAKVSCCDLGDDEIADFKDGTDDSDNEMSDGADDEAPFVPVHCPKPTPRVRTTRKTPVAAPTRQPSTKGSDFLDRIAHSLDPEHQAQCDAERTSALFQSQQLILLQAQIRDLNQTIQTLRNQLNNSERHRAKADRRADQLQNQIYITSVVQ